MANGPRIGSALVIAAAALSAAAWVAAWIASPVVAPVDDSARPRAEARLPIAAGCRSTPIECAAIAVADDRAALDEQWLADESAVGVRPDFAH